MRVLIESHPDVSVGEVWYDVATDEEVEVVALRRHPVTFKTSVVYRRGGGLQESTEWITRFLERYTR